MSLLYKFFRCICMCIIVERKTWYPNANAKEKRNKNHQAILKNKFTKLKAKNIDDNRPVWLKEWTISKGWVHNRSHMLSLGVDKLETNEKLERQVDDFIVNAKSDCGSSISNAEDLISIISVTDDETLNNGSSRGVIGESEHLTLDFNEIELLNKYNNEYCVETLQPTLKSYSEFESINPNDIFKEVSTNYRQNFHSDHTFCQYSDFQLPQIYKERILLNYFKNQNILKHLWNQIKPKKLKFNTSRKYKFTRNQLYNQNSLDRCITEFPNRLIETPKRSCLGRSIALNNTLNSKTNLHEDIIYECSEESALNSLSYIYYNPLYMPHLNYQDIYKTHRSCHSNFFCENTQLHMYNKAPLRQKQNSLRKKLKTEKYVIRHIKVRLMLSLRIGGQEKSKFIFEKRKPRKCSKRLSVRKYVVRMHDEQRRIGNGKTSIKIQNMRHGRLNVLRWLLWEDESREGSTCCSASRSMPALEMSGDEHGHSGNATLALHYAAARGCLDCIRLLVDSSPNLSANTQMDNDVTPVYLAAQEGHLEVLKFLVLEAGGSLYVRAKDGMAPIHAASQMGCLNCVKWMIQEQGVDPNLRDGDGATPLHFAASRGHMETVRWLLKHGARLSLDKYGKSPINDAAENQQVECLNVLVQHGTTPDYQDADTVNEKSSCSCTGRSRIERIVKRAGSISSDCSTCKPKSKNPPSSTDNSLEPFYLHPPLNSRSLEPAHAPENGLYINPMSNQRHSASSCSDSSSNDSINGESFYLHNPEEVIYNRVKDLFDSNGQRQSPLSALTVKVEVHSSSSGAGSDENLSSSDLSSVRSNDHENEYEDIYLVREESRKQDRNNNNRSRSRDSGSHSRSGSVSSSNSGVVVNLTLNKNSFKSKEFLPKPQKLEKQNWLPKEQEPRKITSVPIEVNPPPPPPPPQKNLTTNSGDGPKSDEIVEVVEEPTLRPSDIVKGMCRSMSALSARRLNSSCSDLTVTLNDEENRRASITAQPSNRQRVLPFLPPSFPSTDPNRLVKPSEYLRSISVDKGERSTDVSLVSKVDEGENEQKENVHVEQRPTVDVFGPPPPPLPEFSGDLTQTIMTKTYSQQSERTKQPLSSISIQDLNSVQLRRTETKMVATKTFSAPTRSMSLQCLATGDAFVSQKTDLIAELKMSRDITGIKKMKIEKAKSSESKEKEMYVEITKQFTATAFVDKVPEKDNTGNLIPAWKRQMLAKKAAEKAKKEMEEQIQKEAEEKRLQSIPPWKRQLLLKKEETEKQIRQTIYTPKVVDEPKVNKIENRQQMPKEEVKKEDQNNNQQDATQNDDKEHVDAKSFPTENVEKNERIIPWRAQLRKTSSTLNLLE